MQEKHFQKIFQNFFGDDQTLKRYSPELSFWGLTVEFGIKFEKSPLSDVWGHRARTTRYRDM